MATLELSLDETNAAPVRRKRRLGALFWVAIGWMVLVFAVAIFADLLPLPSPTDMDMLERRGQYPPSTGSAPTASAVTSCRG
jgi:peptide/nickel transport system permease protein